MGFPLNSVWSLNPDAVASLEKLLKAGHSAGEIADKMTTEYSVTFTRNQIMGKLKRMRLSLRGAEVRAEMEMEKLRELTKPKPKPEPKLPKAERKGPKFNSSGTYRPMAPYIPVVKPISSHPGYTFWDVPKNGCMFEITGADTPAKDFRFCGQPRYADESYCEAHFEVTLAPSAVRFKMK